MNNDIKQIYHNCIEQSIINHPDKISESIDIINTILLNNNIKYTYDYNTFCIEFINYNDLLLSEYNENELSSISIIEHVNSVLLFMVNNKRSLFTDVNAEINELLNGLKNNFDKL